MDQSMTQEKKFPIPTKEQEDIEEALSAIWHQVELGILEKEKISALLKEGVSTDAFSTLMNRKFIREEGGKVILTQEGELLAKDVTRRHRLAERLLTDVLALSEHSIDPNACQLEHIISPEVAESICTLLGHPGECPHGSAIPPGKCCNSASDTIEPIIVSLDRLEPGQKGKIAYLLLQSHPELHKLLSLGMVPGTQFNLHQTFPTFVVEIGETTLALEKEIAEHIFVRKAE
jgi:DtxR family transcriptional regulator, Mn-dependent transcriptional regulator